MKKILIIAIMAMSLLAVQGYAQGARGREGGGRGNSSSYTQKGQPSRNKQSSRSSYSASPQRNVNRSEYNKPQTVGRSRNNAPPSSRQGDNRGFNSPHKRAPHPVAPPRYDHNYGHNNWRPTYHHHRSYHHHRHYCIFDSWSWYSWMGYTNRFIRHNLYHNRYFDAMLGYYLWDSFDAPTRIDIGSMSFSRYDGRLKITIGNNVSYFDLYQYQKVTYQVGTTFVQVIVERGYATIYIYDDYGNSATYRL